MRIPNCGFHPTLSKRHLSARRVLSWPRANRKSGRRAAKPIDFVRQENWASGLCVGRARWEPLADVRPWR